MFNRKRIRALESRIVTLEHIVADQRDRIDAIVSQMVNLVSHRTLDTIAAEIVQSNPTLQPGDKFDDLSGQRFMLTRNIGHGWKCTYLYGNMTRTLDNSYIARCERVV